MLSILSVLCLSSFNVNPKPEEEPFPERLNDTLVITKISKDLYICTCKPDIANPGGGGEIYFQGRYKKDKITEDADYHDCDERFLMQWDLSELPEGIKIIEAKMRMVCYGYTGDKKGQLVYECISKPWDENAGYSKKPETLPETRIMADWPVKSTYHYVNITDFVNSWYNGNIPNYGLMGFSINTETTNSALFCSSKFHQEDVRPKLIIIYSKE
ncbi:MAG: DNRLRE domain-containing protein [Deltaproteobacteria bacterium]|nr:DNRLRE domain-containing protein [Deltaproteobacteria bacterium]